MSSLFTSKVMINGRNQTGMLSFSSTNFRRLTVDKSAVDLLKPLMNIHSLAEFADFDNHLDDIAMDWRNISLFQNVPDAIESVH